MAEPNAPSVTTRTEAKREKGPPKDNAQRKGITSALQENLLEDYYSTYQFLEKEHAHGHATAHKIAAELFYDFLDFVMTLYGLDSSKNWKPGAFEEFYAAVSFSDGDTLCTNEWLINVSFLQQQARASYDDPPVFVKRHQNDLLELFRLLMDKSGDTSGCITRERFLQLQPIGDFMYDVNQQSRILGSNAKGIEKARSLQTIRKAGYIPEAPASQAMRMTEFGRQFKAGRFGNVNAHGATKQQWIEDEAINTKKMHAEQKLKAEAEAAAKAAAGEEDLAAAPAFLKREKTFIHKADGTVEVKDS